MEVAIMPEIGKRIKIKREELHMTQEELAAKLGYKSKTTIAKIENGTNDIVQSKVVAFASVLNTTPAYLMGWEESPAAPDSLPSDQQQLNDIYSRLFITIKMTFTRNLRINIPNLLKRNLFCYNVLVILIVKKVWNKIIYLLVRSR